MKKIIINKIYLLLLLIAFIKNNSLAQNQIEKSASPVQIVTTTQPITQSEIEKQNKKFQALESFSRALNIIENMYVEQKDVAFDMLVHKAIKGMLSDLDPHTSYLTAEDLKTFQPNYTESFVGIGIVTSASYPVKIEDVISNSPAEKAGIEIGDIIYAINNEIITQTNRLLVIDKIRGAPGTKVKLDIIKAINVLESEKNNIKNGFNNINLPKIKIYEIKRDVIIEINVVDYELSKGFVYIKIKMFQDNTSEQIDKILKKYKNTSNLKLNGLILDLRFNPGGLLDQAVKLADLFIDSGIIVSTIGRDQTKQDIEYATKRTTHPFMPMIVLVDENTASASEVVAGALQDHGRAVIMGNTTFGKGVVQSVISLPNGGGMKITTARYYTPKGRTVQAKGIIPDIILTNTFISEKNKKIAKKEADLNGHITASDLVQNTSPYAADIAKWNTKLINDQQIKTAYTYLKSWQVFKIDK